MTTEYAPVSGIETLVKCTNFQQAFVSFFLFWNSFYARQIHSNVCVYVWNALTAKAETDKNRIKIMLCAQKVFYIYFIFVTAMKLFIFRFVFTGISFHRMSRIERVTKNKSETMTGRPEHERKTEKEQRRLGMICESSTSLSSPLFNLIRA